MTQLLAPRLGLIKIQTNLAGNQMHIHLHAIISPHCLTQKCSLLTSVINYCIFSAKKNADVIELHS